MFGTTIICNGGLKTLRFTIWIKKSFNPWKEIFDFVCDRNSLEEVVHEGLKIHKCGSSGNSWSKIVKLIGVHDESRNKWSRLNLATIVNETTISPFLEPCEVNLTSSTLIVYWQNIFCAYTNLYILGNNLSKEIWGFFLQTSLSYSRKGW